MGLLHRLVFRHCVTQYYFNLYSLILTQCRYYNLTQSRSFDCNLYVSRSTTTTNTKETSPTGFSQPVGRTIVGKEVANSVNSDIGKTFKTMNIGKAIDPHDKPGRMDISTSLKTQQEVSEQVKWWINLRSKWRLETVELREQEAQLGFHRLRTLYLDAVETNTDEAERDGLDIHKLYIGKIKKRCGFGTAEQDQRITSSIKNKFVGVRDENIHCGGP